MVNKVRNFIQENKLFEKESKLLLGLSGGRDSVVLLHVLLSLGYQVEAAHCNFNLRGQESDNETKFVKSLCKKWGVSCHVKHFETLKIKDDTSESIQFIARELRYNWFDELLSCFDLDKTLTAHQLDDQIETFFINLSRGTGLKGLLGIPKKRDSIVRPLLSVTRDEVTAYATINNLEFKDDSSNEKDAYLRNNIRHHVVPQFISLNPGFHGSFEKTIDHLSKVQSFWRISYDKWFKVWEVTDDVHFYVSDILSKGEESFLSYYLNEIGFSHSDVKDLFVKNEAHHTGAVLLSKGHKLWYDRGEWVLSKKIETGFSRRYFLNDSKLPLSLSYSLKTVDLSTKIPTSKLVSWVDKTKVNGELFVKRWEQGDVFYPLGMSNKKKLSDYFIDNKISRRDKEKIWLLCDEKSIIWIIGNRLDNRYKVTDKTKDIIEFKVKV